MGAQGWRLQDLPSLRETNRSDLSQLLCTGLGDFLGSRAGAAIVCILDPRMGSCAVLGVAPQVCGRSGTGSGYAGTPPRRVQ